MADAPQILIVGSGPVGLTAAIELDRRGHKVRLIDKAEGPFPQSRALAINPRSLEILEPCGATDIILDQGLKVRQARIFEPPRELFSINFDKLDHRFNFIAVLPQSKTERIFIDILKTHGIELEWQTELTSLKKTENGTTCILENAEGNQEEITPQIVIGADGAHSSVRTELDIQFKGDVYPHDWGLADVRFTSDTDQDFVGSYIHDKAICGIIPLGDGLHRIVSDQPDVIKALPKNFTVEEILWQSRFRISHRQVETYQKGNMFLAGDAAHIHSPVGGRGMNLGIEDAATLSFLIDQNRTAEYNDLRWPVGEAVLRATERQSSIISGGSFSAIMFMRYIVPLIMKTPLMQINLREMMGVSTPTPEWLAW